MNKASFIWHRNKVKMQIDDITLFERLRLKFSVESNAAKYCEYASDSTSCITPLGSFNPGMFYDIKSELMQMAPNIQIECTQDVLDKIKPLGNINTEIEMPKCNDNIQERDYQRDAVVKAFFFGRGIFEAPTGVGKSYIIYSICHNLINRFKKFPILVLVPNLQLVKQMYSDFVSYGCKEEDVCMFSSFSTELSKNTKIIISNRQWLERHFDELPEINAIQVDECQQLKAENSVTDFVRKLKTSIRFGFTGTLPENTVDLWAVKGIVGPLLYTERAKTFQKDGTLSPVKLISILLEHGQSQPYTPDPAKKFHVEWKAIEASKKAISKISELSMKTKGNTITLFDHTDHGKELYNECIRQALYFDKDVYFINGEVELDKREDIRKKMEQFDNIVLIANCKCFGTGINIKNIDNIILAMSGKGQTKIIQAIGRGLRPKEGKNFLVLFDIRHDYYYSQEHFLQRIVLYKEHYGKGFDKSITIKL